MVPHHLCYLIQFSISKPPRLICHLGLPSVRIHCITVTRPPLSFLFPLSHFPPTGLCLAPGRKSPLVHFVLRIEPHSILKALFPYCSSSRIKYTFTALTSVWLWFSLTETSCGKGHPITLAILYWLETGPLGPIHSLGDEIAQGCHTRWQGSLGAILRAVYCGSHCGPVVTGPLSVAVSQSPNHCSASSGPFPLAPGGLMTQALMSVIFSESSSSPTSALLPFGSHHPICHMTLLCG